MYDAILHLHHKRTNEDGKLMKKINIQITFGKFGSV